MQFASLASQWAVAHRRSVIFLAAFVAAAGLFASFSLPVALFPHVNFPRVVVSIEAGDQPADQMVIAVTRPVEQAVRSVPGLAGMRSTTSRGSAELSINFNWGEDMVSAMLQVESSINQALPSLPAGTRFNIRRMDPTVFPIAAYSLVSDHQTLVQLRDIASYQLVPLLSSIEGVANVAVLGGQEAEYRVEVDPEKLAAYKLTFSDVASALSANNVLTAVGRLEDHYKLYLMISDTRIQSLENIDNTVLRSGNDGLVRLKNIARIYPSTTPNWLRVTADGHDAVLLQIYQQPSGNTVKIIKGIKQQLEANAQQLPTDVKISNWYDQSELVTMSARSVANAIAIGVLLAAVVLFLFLRSLKITLVAVLVVPSALASTILLLHALGMSFNIMTLGGMAAAVGLIVDDAIVMIEHIVRRMRERRSDIALTVREAAAEFTPALAGSSAATIVIFAPLAFLSGVSGEFFKALSLTMASSLLISFLLSWLVLPVLAAHMLSQKDAQAEDNHRWFEALLGRYRGLMQRLLKTPSMVLLVVIPFVLIGFFAYKHVGSGFMPEMDEGGFVLDYRTAAGTSLTETDRLLQQVESILRQDAAVETYSRRTGLQLGGGLTEANEGDFFVRLKSFPRAPITEVMDRTRNRIEQEVPGIEIEMVLLMEDVIGDLTAVPQPVEIKLYSDQLDQLLAVAPRVAEAIGAIHGIVDVKDGVVLAGDAINITIDRDKAALEGIDPDLVTKQLEAWFKGIVTTQVQENIKLVGVRVWVPEAARDKTDAVDKIWLRAADGHRFPLKRIATVITQSGQPQITRDNLKRMVAVTARISGRDLGSTIKEVKQVLAKKGLLATGMYYELGGLYKQQQIAFRGLLLVFVAALALVFLLLLFMYEEFAAAVAIMTSPLLAIAAVFTGLWVTGINLNITAMMGMTMIIGIVTEVSIFYFSEFHERLAAGDTRDVALLEAGSSRLRPIVMTTLAAIFALLPLALAFDAGSAMQQPLAVAIIAGLLVQIPLVVLVMPIVYRSLSDF